MQSFTSIPFKTDAGLSQVNGVAKLSPAGIVLEFESKLFGLISNGVKEARISLGDLLSVKFKKGMLKRGARIEIRLNSFTLLSTIPNKDGKITLKLVPEDFEAARDAVSRLEQDLAGYTASLPPPHPPLVSLFDEGEEETRRLDE